MEHTKLSRTIMPRSMICAVMLGLLCASAQVLAAQPPKPACGTTGPLQVTTPTPNSYSYVTSSAGSSSLASFTVTSPPVQNTGSCDSVLPPVYGQGSSGSLEVTISTGNVTVVEPVGGTLTTAQVDALKGGFSFAPSGFTLTNPGSGSQAVGFTFTNTPIVPVGTYDVTLDVKPETGVGVGEAQRTFTVIVTAPVAVDTQPPGVTIGSPSAASKLCVHGNLAVSFTANDPVEGGAGTGITAMRAIVASVGGAVETVLTDGLSISPALPVDAGIDVTATGNFTVDGVGAFTLTAEADDDASHTGEAASSYTVALNVNPLPPMSVAGRQFKVGSTLPIKWVFTDCEGKPLPPYESVRILVKAPDGQSEYVAGEGSSNIRWELDAAGNAIQYIANYPIPVVGTYLVEVSVDDVDGNPAKQGEVSFIASTKGGK